MAKTVDDIKSCPFCGAPKGAIYQIQGSDFHGFNRPEFFCDGCKATVYFEDSSSTGVDDYEDYKKLEAALKAGWNTRSNS